ncbi:ferrochelatase [Schizosaccharomyces cryophilus OY26]|uniref:Ferrochelatase n=1 Tax=Schizosaccharomyces cryophilus (strain OY26 / ATCC MYA-4695 / CBS 11777 / NBRC 106824 / NRRL Y48691) TaxID=653667 RepID=S9VQ30_SCHCR|nr:ferrochelatase [Schizosaccharomyces cryophilus OY26]EPY50068.1 ferrochelatase [Schizosaccharomyces cryophilus OY26]
MIRFPFARCPVIRPRFFPLSFHSGFQNPSSLARMASSLATKTAEPIGSQDGASKKGPTAIVMLNMGGPSNLDEVGPFLQRLFADGDIIPLGYFQNSLGKFIAKRRTPAVREHYKEIGGGSPILHWTEYQGKEICKILDETSPQSAPHVPFVAFRYAPPLTEEMLKELKESKIKRAVAFSQYPQWSCSTSGASLNELRKQLLEMNMEQDVEWSVLDRWSLQEGLLDAFAENIQKTLETYPKEERDNAVIIFSAHSLPMSQVSKGDPYVNEIAATTYGVMQKLGFKNRFINSWQSKVGPIPWMSPSTEDVIQQLGKQGHKNMILVPVAFTSDHIETLKELEDYIEDAKSKGIMGVKRAPSINDNPIAIRGMADLVKLHLETNTAHSRQFTQRCPGCTNESCQKRIEFFQRF